MVSTCLGAFRFYRSWPGRGNPYLNFHLLQMRKVAIRGTAAEEVVLIATLIVVTAPLGPVAALLIIVISCHLGSAGLTPRCFKSCFGFWPQRLATFRTSWFWSWLQCQVILHFSNCKTYFCCFRQSPCNVVIMSIKYVLVHKGLEGLKTNWTDWINECLGCGLLWWNCEGQDQRVSSETYCKPLR